MKARRKKPGIRAIDPPDPKKSKVKSGSKAVIKRNKKGDLTATLKDDFAGVTQETMREDAAVRAKTGDGDYDGGPAPRVGGKAEKSEGAVRGGTKKMVRKAKRRVGKSAASKAAKRSARKIY